MGGPSGILLPGGRLSTPSWSPEESSYHGYPHNWCMKMNTTMGLCTCQVGSVTEAITVGGLDVAAVRAVVFRGSIDVPPVDGVESSCPPGAGFLMNLCIASHGR
jgi:hypothetical protein